MPVFNEQASVRRVITEWFRELEGLLDNFAVLAIDDGSTDATLPTLRSLQAEFGPRLECISRENRGHGQTCLQGYRIAVEREIPFVFQIDSDGQSDPRYFRDFWVRRNEFDVIYGRRIRQDGTRRIVASLILRYSLRCLAKVDCMDANVPYRLMNTTSCAPAFYSIPAEISLANIALAVVLKRNPSIRHGFFGIGFPARYGGETSVPFSKFASKAIELFRQLKTLEPGALRSADFK
ncbi:MAG: glycosyltransferase family 2 protein [Luteolibacter sp.]